MTYYLGIDLGTTFTAAAVWRDGRVEIATLGTRTPEVPSVVLLREDGTVLTGEAAARRAITEPERIAREFKRRFGDPTPIMVGGTPYSPDALTARLLRWVVEHVSEREGERPAGITVSHPANWGPFKQDLLRQVFRLADLGDVTTITEPEAAAIHYASQERVEVGAVIAIYDLGGGTFDAAVLRRTDGGWEVLGEPEGVERLGGVDFDQAVVHHVSTAIGSSLDELDPNDATAITAMARLRQECIDAKEALASDVDVTIPVLLPTIQTEVRLTRSELEDMIRPALADSIGALRRALASAHVPPDEVTSVLLVGGSSRLPLVAELVGSELRRPVAVDAHPKHGVALGAAIIAAERSAGRSLATEVVPSIETITPAEVHAPRPAVIQVAATAAAAPRGTPKESEEHGEQAGHDREADAAPAAAASAAAPTGVPAGAAAMLVAPVAERPEAGDATQAMPAPAAGAGSGGGTASAPPPTVHVPAPPVRRTTSTAPVQPPARPAVAPASRPPGGGANGGGGGSRRRGPSSSPPWAVIAGGLVVAAAMVAAVIFLTNDDGGGDDTRTDDTEQAVTTTTDSPTTSASTTSTPATNGPTATLTGVSLAPGDDGLDHYLVTYTWQGFEPDAENPDALHFHFYLDTTAAENAGTNGNPPGDWHLTDAPGEFLTKYGPDNRGEATQMCVVVANSAHEVVDPASGNCLPLPA